jgi:hypothetical protein
MKTHLLLISFLCMFVCNTHAQVQQRNATLPSGLEKAGFSVNPPQLGFKPNQMMIPAKRNMFDSSGYLWKWDTIMCYNVASGDNPFQRATRTYNSLGEQLTLLYERRVGSLAWENYAREADTYDSAGNWVGQVQEIWQNNAWVNFQKQEFVYNANGDMVDWKRMMWDSTAWDNGWHYSWHFDANGLNDTTIYQEGQDNLWLNHWLWISTYDGNGYLTSVLTYNWINNGWEVAKLATYTYDSSGNTLTLHRQDWVNSSWVNSEFYTYTWDTAGNRLSTLYQEWQNNAWVNAIFLSYTYDPMGNKIVDLTQLWSSGSWVNSGRTLYEYDGSSNKQSQMSQGWESSYWRNQKLQQYSYDSSGNSLTGKYQWWYQNSWQPEDGGLAVFANHEQDIVLSEIYRYTADVDSVLVFIEPTSLPLQVTLFPNPAHSMVYVSSRGASSDQNGSLKMYDLRGQLILTKQMESETTGIDVSGLKPGVYFVRFSDDRGTRVLKFVKE